MYELICNSIFGRAIFLINSMYIQIISFFLIIVHIKKSKRLIILDIILLVSGYMMYNGLLYAMYVIKGSITSSGLREKIIFIPQKYILIFGFFISLIVSFLFYDIMKFKKRSITGDSIRESIDYMPCGVCYSFEGGLIKLSNYEMEKICYELTGKALNNAENFWAALNSGNIISGNNIIRSGEEPIVQGTSGQVWSFIRKKIPYFDTYIFELLAIVITNEYEKGIKLEHDNLKMLEINSRLRKFSQNVTAVTIEKEVLATKIKIHDELGSALITTRRYLSSGDIKKSDLLDLWQKNIELLKNEVPEIIPDEYDSVMQIADSAKISLVIDGELPQETKLKKIISIAISQCITNTFRHAHGDTVFIKIERDEYNVFLKFENNGEAPKSEITETGGLKNLRNATESAGGEMIVSSSPQFILKIILPLTQFGDVQ